MDWNKQVAIKAKETAERKLTELDIAGAKKFATIAQNLYPELEGLSQFLTTLNVYVSVKRRMNGDIDWYKVLGVDPAADDDTIRQHYVKVALVLHPDRNKSVGANGAFKIISKAWSLLSNKAERTAYDKKLATSLAAGRGVIDHIAKNDGSDSQNWRSVPQSKPLLSTHLPKNSFWTACGSCKVQFEYLMTYLNHNLICSNCHMSFVAVEVPPPPLCPNDSYSSQVSTTWQPYPSLPNMIQTSNNAERTISSGVKPGTVGYMGIAESWRKPFFSGTLFEPGADEKVRALASSDVTEPTFGQMKKKHNSASYHREAYPFEKTLSAFTSMPFTCGSTIPECAQLKKNKRIAEAMFNGHCRDFGEQNAVENVGTSNGSTMEFQKRELGRVRYDGNNRSICRKEFGQEELRNMLIRKARSEIRKKLGEWKMDENLPTSNKIVSDKEIGLNASNGIKDSQNSVENSMVEGSDPFSMIVPDPDFHDFDKDRTEKAFCSNQIWAVYDDDDGMPRYYAMIHNVISLKPFKMRISWLNSKSNTELSPLNWIGCGFPKTSGEFWIGKHEINGFLNSFSHKVSWIKGSRGVVHIYPKKGEVWALYRNWSPKWNQFTPDEVIHKYDMVEVLEDYNEQTGVVVVPLIKVVGFRTIFRQHSNPNAKREIPRAEMFRFSHQVPSYLLKPSEGQNAPAGCRELDPAATPLELLQKTTQMEETDIDEITESSKSKDLLDVENGDREIPVGDITMEKEKKSDDQPMLVYSRKRSRGIENARVC